MKKYFYLIMIASFLIVACNNAGENNTDETSQNGIERYQNVEDATLERLNQIYTEYINLKNALVETDAAQASEAARSLAQTSKEMDYEKIDPDARVFLEEKIAAVDQSAEAIAGSADVEQQREKFYQLSQEMYSIVKAFNVTSEPVYYQYCPMAFDDAGAAWLSNEKQIRNPYFGDVMLKCGEVREVIE